MLDHVTLRTHDLEGTRAFFETVDRTGETIDHVDYHLTDHDGLRRKLDDLSIPYSGMELPELGERRLFVQTPTGISLELVFREGRTTKDESD